MLNKKGFTIAEVLVSFSLIAVILISVVSATIFYRDRLKQEEVINQLNDFKNTITKAVYDDIIDNSVQKVEKCVGMADCVNFIDNNNKSHILRIEELPTSGSDTRGVYVYYNGVKYLLPDSDLGTGGNRICDFVGGIQLDEYNNGELYMVKASFRHKDADLRYDLLFVVS